MALAPGTWALTWHPESGYALVQPAAKPNSRVPDKGVALVALMLRLERDPTFLQEQVDWFRTQAA
jgi:hypothetical protein